MPDILKASIGDVSSVHRLMECVQKFTALPVGRLGLPNRGVVREGYAADIVCPDPSSVQDTATFDEPQIQATESPTSWLTGGSSSSTARSLESCLDEHSSQATMADACRARPDQPRVRPEGEPA